MRRLLEEIMRYGVVSGIALAVDTLVLLLLVRYGGWHYLPASVAAFISGATVAYALSVWFVFPIRRLDNRALEFGCFVGVGVAGLLVNSATLFVAVGTAGINLLAAKALAACCTFATNFAIRRRLLFSLPSTLND